MAKNKIVIIGAGPAGLIAAAELAKAGKDVVVFDQNKEGQIDAKGETKLCGGGLTPLAQEFLGEIKSEVLENRSIVIKSVHATAELKFDFPLISTINRDELAKELAERAKTAGARIEFGKKVGEVNFGDHQIVVGAETITYSALIGADGVLSVVRKKLEEEGKIKQSDKFAQALEYKVSRDVVKRPLTIDFDYRLFANWYAWIFPHKDYIYIGAGESDTTRKKSGRHLIDDLRAWAAKEKLPFNEETLRGWTIPNGFQGYKFSQDVYLAGDAGGFVTDIAGEGILSAMYSGFDIAHLIIDKRYRPTHIEKLLRNKKRQARMVWLGEHLPFLRPVLMNSIIWLFRSKMFSSLILKHYYLWPEKRDQAGKLVGR